MDLDLGGGVVASIGVQPETDLEVEQNREKGGWGGKLSADQVICLLMEGFEKGEG